MIGFIMMAYCKADLSDSTKKNGYCIWRFMIGEQYQGKGYGRTSLIKALDILKHILLDIQKLFLYLLKKIMLKQKNCTIQLAL